MAVTPVQVVLDCPLRSFGEDVATLVFSRRANLGDMKAAETAGKDHDVAQMAVLIQRLGRTVKGAEEPQDAIDSLDVDDFGKVVAAMTPFLPGGRQSPSGGQSSDSSP
ncbi:MAG TPA: hypothetical protein DEB56_07130 [Thiobacillus sp.]|nr:hypothetical protein [Thiobacillus sp.]